MATGRLHKFIRRHLDRLAACLDEIVAAGDARAVHRLRVSTRRLNEPLKILAAAATASRKKARKARRGLKALRKNFGEVRDLDVMMASLSDQEHQTDATVRNSGPPGRPMCEIQPSQATAATLQEVLSKRRRIAMSKAIETLPSLSPDRTIARIESLLTTRFKPDDADFDASLRSEGRKMWQTRAAAFLKEDAAEEDFHAIRIELKALRYCTELLFRMESRDGEPVLTELRRMQDALGAWNDHLVAARYLAALATDGAHDMHDPASSSAWLREAAMRIEASAECLDAARAQRPVVHNIIAAGQGRGAHFASRGNGDPDAVEVVFSTLMVTVSAPDQEHRS